MGDLRKDLVNVLKESKNEVPDFLMRPCPLPAKKSAYEHKEYKNKALGRDSSNLFKKDRTSYGSKFNSSKYDDGRKIINTGYEDSSDMKSPALEEKQDSDDDVPGEWK